MKAKWATALAVIFVFCSAPILAADPAVTVEELVKEYDRFELPNVPGDAKLVTYRQYNSQKIAFLIKPKSRANQQYFDMIFRELVTQYLSPETQITVIPFTVEAVKQSISSTSKSDLLEIIIQCHKLGYRDLANNLFYNHYLKGAKSETAPIQSLRYSAWGYWSDQIQTMEADRRQVLKHLKELKRLDPTIVSRRSFTIETLELALAPRNAKPGSMESLIDALVDDEEANILKMQLPDWGPSIRKILAQGFDIIPTLITHLDDRRRTRYRLTTYSADEPTLLVGSLCGMILCEFAGKEFPHVESNWNEGRTKGWDDHNQGRPPPTDLNPLERDAVNDWWKEVQTIGEKKYLLSIVGETPAQHRSIYAYRYQNSVALETIAAKYPQELKSIYLKEVSEEKRKYYDGYIIKKMLETPAVMQKIDKKEMRKLIEPALHHQDEYCRTNAERAIMKLDPKEYADRQLKRIETFDFTNKKVDSTSITKLIYMCQLSDDPRIISAVILLVQKMPSNHKMTFLDAALSSFDRKSNLQLFQSLLNDDSKYTCENRSLPSASNLDPEDIPYSKKYSLKEFAAKQLMLFLCANYVYEKNRPGDEWAYIQKWLTDEVAKELKK